MLLDCWALWEVVEGARQVHGTQEVLDGDPFLVWLIVFGGILVWMLQDQLTLVRCCLAKDGRLLMQQVGSREVWVIADTS